MTSSLKWHPKRHVFVSSTVGLRTGRQVKQSQADVYVLLRAKNYVFFPFALFSPPPVLGNLRLMSICLRRNRGGIAMSKTKEPIRGLRIGANNARNGTFSIPIRGKSQNVTEKHLVILLLRANFWLF